MSGVLNYVDGLSMLIDIFYYGFRSLIHSWSNSLTDHWHSERVR